MENKVITKSNVKIAKSLKVSLECICNRPYTNIICNGCGFWIKGRVRYSCQQHPKILFLHDYDHCPRCKSHDFMLTEM